VVQPVSQMYVRQSQEIKLAAPVTVFQIFFAQNLKRVLVTTRWLDGYIGSYHLCRSSKRFPLKDI
jgi:hypothetical protein